MAKVLPSAFLKLRKIFRQKERERPLKSNPKVQLGKPKLIGVKELVQLPNK